MSATETTYKTSLINNRRYLGNKYKLLSFITCVVNDECADIETVADIFAGTGAVSSAFADKTLITNDLMYSNYICNFAWFGAESYEQQKVIDYVVRYNAKTNCGENYMTRNFADTYFSKKDCAKIGYIREDIERNYKKGNLNNRERAILITSLLYAMDKIAVTCGHYDAYRKGVKFEGTLELYCIAIGELNMKKLLITDLDDTLYDWLGYFIPSFYGMVDEIASITKINKDVLLKEFKSIHQSYGSVEYPFATLELPSILNKYNGKSKEDIKEILGEAFHKFNSIRKRNLKLYDGVEDTLKQLFENGITIIGYTESAQENGFYRLKKLGIAQCFKNIYTSESKYISDIPLDKKIITVKTKKPDKDILITICKQEKCSISETVYIGDSLTKDVYMAKMANITSIWANYPKDNNNYYNLLVDITSWSEEDFKREKELKEQYISAGIKPDYTISKFSQVLPIVLQDK